MFAIFSEKKEPLLSEEQKVDTVDEGFVTIRFHLYKKPIQLVWTTVTLNP